MVHKEIQSLQKQIAEEEEKRKKIAAKVLEQSKIQALKIKLKGLQRTPEQLRREAIIKRTGKGLRILGGKAGRAIKRQAIRIKKQQIRDEALSRRGVRKVGKAGKKAGKKIKKGIKESSMDIFDGLPGLGFGN